MNLADIQEGMNAYGPDLPAGPLVYQHVSHSQLSLARHYRGLNVSGAYYVYVPEADALVREDLFKTMAKAKKAARKKEEPKVEQGVLL